MPLSEAIFFASGDAKIRPLGELFDELTVFASSVFAAAGCTSTFSEVLFSAGAEAPPLATIAETSVPAGPIIVNKLSTGAVSHS